MKTVVPQSMGLFVGMCRIFGVCLGEFNDHCFAHVSVLCNVNETLSNLQRC